MLRLFPGLKQLLALPKPNFWRLSHYNPHFIVIFPSTILNIIVTVLATPRLSRNHELVKEALAVLGSHALGNPAVFLRQLLDRRPPTTSLLLPEAVQ